MNRHHHHEPEGCCIIGPGPRLPTPGPHPRPRTKYGGVTGPFTGFLTALTPFLRTGDLCNLARVSCEDHKSTDKLWTMCHAMLSPVTRTSTLEVIRQETVLLPQCLAYAMSHSRRVIQTFFASTWRDCVSFGMLHRMAYWGSYYISFRFAAAPSRNQLLVITSPRGYPSLDNDAAARSFRDHFSQWYGYRDVDGCIRMLQRTLMVYGAALTGISLRHPRAVDALVTLWFDLGVAPTLTIHFPDDDLSTEAEIRQSAVFQRYHTQVTLVPDQPHRLH
jgi:hypothetical protein